jgi:hypothetical protein
MELATFIWRPFLLTLGVLFVAIFFARLPQKRGLSWWLSVAISAICFMALPLLLLIDGCDYNGSMHTALSYSPDRKHISRVVVWRGSALDADYAKVILRSAKSPFYTVVYEGSWFGDEDGSETPHLSWEGNQRLMLEVPAEYFQPQMCKSLVESIQIECRTVKAD